MTHSSFQRSPNFPLECTYAHAYIHKLAWAHIHKYITVTNTSLLIRGKLLHNNLHHNLIAENNDNHSFGSETCNSVRVWQGRILYVPRSIAGAALFLIEGFLSKMAHSHNWQVSVGSHLVAQPWCGPAPVPLHMGPLHRLSSNHSMVAVFQEWSPQKNKLEARFYDLVSEDR